MIKALLPTKLINKSFVKNSIATAMLASAALGTGIKVNAANSQNELNSQNVELISNAGADALRAKALQTQDFASGNSNVHNYELDRTLNKFVESSNDKAYVDKITNSVYQYNGPYLGSAFMQAEIDYQSFCAFIEENTAVMKKNNINPNLAEKIEGFGAKFYKDIAPQAEKITDWRSGVNENLKANLKFDHKPSAREVADRLDSYVDNNKSFTEQEKITYYKSIKQHQQNANKKRISNTQKYMNEIAFRVYSINVITIEREMTKAGYFGPKSSFKDSAGLSVGSYFYQWINSTKPGR